MLVVGGIPVDRGIGQLDRRIGVGNSKRTTTDPRGIPVEGHIVSDHSRSALGRVEGPPFARGVTRNLDVSKLDPRTASGIKTSTRAVDDTRCVVGHLVTRENRVVDLCRRGICGPEATPSAARVLVHSSRIVVDDKVGDTAVEVDVDLSIPVPESSAIAG